MHCLSFPMWSVRCRLCRLQNPTPFLRGHVREHKHSVIGKRLRDVHNLRNKDLRDQFTILKKCRRKKLDCLSYEMLFIKKKQQQQRLTVNQNPLRQKFLFDNSSPPRLEFYFISFSFINCMHWLPSLVYFHYIMI